MVGAVAVARLDLTARGFATRPPLKGMARRRGGFWRSRSFLKARTERARLEFAGWTGRPCGTGRPATMTKVWPGCVTGPGEGVRRSFQGSSGGSSPRWSRLAPIRRRTRSFAGAGLICAMRSSDALASICMNVRLARSWPPWVTAVCPCARNIPKAIRRPRRPFKNVWPAPSARDFSRAPMISLLQRIRLRRTPSQPRWRYAHSGPHKLPGVERRFLNQAFGAPFDCQAISISPLANLIDRSAHFSALRLCPDQRLRRQGQSPDDEPFAAP